MNNQSFEIFEKSSIENELNKYKKIKTIYSWKPREIGLYREVHKLVAR